MFGRSRGDSFQLYGKRRSRWRLPGWLLWWLFGAAAGAAGVVYVQERHLPPRLSASETAALRSAYAKADAERTELSGVRAERDTLAQTAAAHDTTLKRLRADVDSAVDALPPDPRGGTVEVRAARFEVRSGALIYEAVLTRAKPTSEPLSAVMQLIATADPSRPGAESLPPIPLSIGRHQIVRGQVALPAGLSPKQVTLQVLDRPDGRSLGMRVLWVQ